MATTTKLDKRDLKTPDEFLSTGTKVAHYIAENSTMVIGGTLLALVAIAVAFGWFHQKTEREIEASGKLFAGEKLLSGSDATSRMLGMAFPGTIPDEDKKKALEIFDKVATEYPGSAAARRARLRAGDVHMQLGAYDDAIASWEKALSGAGPEETYYARNGIAHAFEAKKSWDDAASAYRKIADDESIPMRDTATIDLARVLGLGGKAEEGRTILAGFSAKFPESALKETAEKELVKLGGTPATPTPAESPAGANPATDDGSGG